eukprot:10159446-Alexandrium_andersonii.AAC.1
MRGAELRLTAIWVRAHVAVDSPGRRPRSSPCRAPARLLGARWSDLIRESQVFRTFGYDSEA